MRRGDSKDFRGQLLNCVEEKGDSHAPHGDNASKGWGTSRYLGLSKGGSVAFQNEQKLVPHLQFKL